VLVCHGCHRQVLVLKKITVRAGTRKRRALRCEACCINWGQPFPHEKQLYKLMAEHLVHTLPLKGRKRHGRQPR
jgi:hypothetical protein